MGRTLYLSESKGVRVIRDGPSVWVKWMDRSGQRIPVRLVSRVVIIGNVRLDSGSITLFTENDVPIVFMNYSGDEVAVAIPYNHRLAKHYEGQKVFLETPKNVERFRKWAETKRMVIQVDILKRLFRKMDYEIRFGVGEGNYRELLLKLRPADEEKWLTVTGVVNNLLRGMIIERLIKADLDPHVGILHRRHNFGLALDACYVMGGESDFQSLQFFRSPFVDLYIEKKAGRWLLTETGMKNIIQRFENRRDALTNMAEIVIDELFELMRELRT